jgi:hypothetical protein
MITMVIPRLLSIPLLLSVADLAPRYAVLVSAHSATQGMQALDGDFWNDMVGQYKMLRAMGFERKKIFVLYGDGSSCDTCTFDLAETVSLLPAGRAQLSMVFKNIADEMTDGGYLYVWWMSHGVPLPDYYDDCLVALQLEFGDGDREIKGKELRDWMDGVTKAARRDLFVEACFSEGIIRTFKSSSSTIALSSVGCADFSTDLDHPCDGVPHADFNFWATAAILGQDACKNPSGAQVGANGRISLGEIRRYAEEKRTQRGRPRICDPQGIAAKTYLDKAGPSPPVPGQVPAFFLNPSYALVRRLTGEAETAPPDACRE